MIFKYRFVGSPLFMDNDTKIRIRDVFPVGDGFVGIELLKLDKFDIFIFRHMKHSKVTFQHSTRNGLVNLRIVDIDVNKKILVFEYCDL